MNTTIPVLVKYAPVIQNTHCTRLCSLDAFPYLQNEQKEREEFLTIHGAQFCKKGPKCPNLT